MTKFGITYTGYEKDTFGWIVKFDIKGIIYKYEVPFFWVEKIEQIARNSEPKALNMAKKQGIWINEGKRSSNDNSTTDDTEQNDSSQEVEARPEVLSRPEELRSSNTSRGRPGMAESSTSQAILRAREVMRRVRGESNVGGD